MSNPHAWKRYQYPYSFIRRASQYEKTEMLETVASLNELAYEDWQTHGYILEHRLERCGDAWGVASYIIKIHPEVADDYEVDQLLYTMSLVRCSACGAVRELADGQGEFCLECGDDWEK